MSDARTIDTRASVVVRPGEPVPDSGIYEARTAHAALGRSTLVRGKTAPPIAHEGGYWVQIYDTNPDDASSRPSPDG